MKFNFRIAMMVLLIVLLFSNGFAQFTPPKPPLPPQNFQHMHYYNIPELYNFQVFLTGGDVVNGESRMHKRFNKHYLNIQQII